MQSGYHLNFVNYRAWRLYLPSLFDNIGNEQFIAIGKFSTNARNSTIRSDKDNVGNAHSANRNRGMRRGRQSQASRTSEGPKGMNTKGKERHRHIYAASAVGMGVGILVTCSPARMTR